MTKVNLLFGILSPRDIPEALEAFNKIKNVDKVYIKYYMPEQDAYQELRSWFLRHEKYTHLIMISDDCIVMPEHIERIRKGVEEKDFEILTGFGNVNTTDKADIYTVSLREIPILKSERTGSINFLLKHNEMFDKDGNCKFGEYFKVKWCGLGLTCMRRDVVEKIPFEDDSIPNGRKPKTGCCTDSRLSYEWNKANIPIYCDPKIKVHHMRVHDGGLMTNWGAGRYPRKIIFEKRTDKIIIPT